VIVFEEEQGNKYFPYVDDTTSAIERGTKI
jgi:hypothetical protein